MRERQAGKRERHREYSFPDVNGMFCFFFRRVDNAIFCDTRSRRRFRQRRVTQTADSIIPLSKRNYVMMYCRRAPVLKRQLGPRTRTYAVQKGRKEEWQVRR